MSGEAQGEQADDRRVRKTRAALRGAFEELVQERRYAELRVADIVSAADVGRSTFYEHYRDKDELLVQSLGPLLDVFARAGFEVASGGALEGVLAHFQDVRPIARHLFAGPPSAQVVPRIERDLARRVEELLEQRLRERGARCAVAVPLAALQIAAAELALLRAWLSGATSAGVPELALALRRGAAGTLAALLEPADAPRS
jgi:AcrR family transcriptional regulator